MKVILSILLLSFLYCSQTDKIDKRIEKKNVDNEQLSLFSKKSDDYIKEAKRERAI